MVNFGELRQLKHRILYPECDFHLTLHPLQKHNVELLYSDEFIYSFENFYAFTLERIFNGLAGKENLKFDEKLNTTAGYLENSNHTI